MKFRTKRELLRYLGKSEGDNKLIDRMILRDEVRKENGMYILVDKDVEIEELKKEIKNLTNKIDELEQEIANASVSIDYSEITRRIYVYLKEVLHINVRYDDLVEFIENYPSE